MTKRAFCLSLLFAFTLALAAACADAPRKFSSRKLPVCQSQVSKLAGVPYHRLDTKSCAVAIEPFDVSAWIEAAMNSHKVRGVKTVQLGCKPLSVPADNCTTCGLRGHSNTLMMNFDPTVYPDDLTVRRAVLAVYSPDNAQGLYEAQLRGRLNVGDDLQSLARSREGTVNCEKGQRHGWIMFDVTNFVARAINERRNSISFEVSIPCQTPATNLVTVGVNQMEPRLVLEYN